jgi:hypothetical protein
MYHARKKKIKYKRTLIGKHEGKNNLGELNVDIKIIL